MLVGYICVLSLGCGTTWASTGIVGLLKGTSAELAIAAHSAQLYKELHDEGHDIGIH